MLFIERDYDLWPGDIPWLMAQSMVMIAHGSPKTDSEVDIHYTIARKLLDTNAGAIIRV